MGIEATGTVGDDDRVIRQRITGCGGRAIAYDRNKPGNQ
jgi:hypothetical protein